jgi:thiamine biosynthesis protein ThiS
LPESAAAMIRIVFNGQPREVPEGLSVLGLLELLGLDSGRVAVELDGVIVRKPDWPVRTLVSGSRLEVVHFVGGGSGQKNAIDRAARRSTIL